MNFGYHLVRWGWGNVSENLSMILDDLSEAGYNTIEVSDVDIEKYLENPRVFHHLLLERGIKAVALSVYNLEPLLLRSWDPYRLYVWRRFKRLLNFAYHNECDKLIVVGLMTAKARLNMNLKDYKMVSKVFNRIGIECKKLNIDFSYHPTMGSIGTTSTQINNILEITDSGYVNLTLDTGHISISGYDPIELIEQYRNRINHIHLKDVKGGIFTELGEGTDIDIPGILKKLNDINFKEYIIIEDEVIDNPPPLSVVGKTIRSPIETLKRSKDYVTKIMESIN